MKKALAILMVLATVAVAAYADVADIAVSGNASVTFGYDLDAEASGFTNAAEWKISIPLLAKKSFTTKGEGDSYAEITIKDAQFYINGVHDKNGKSSTDINKDFTIAADKTFDGDKKIDSMSATMYFGKVYMTVYGAPDFSPNFADIWNPIKSDKEFYAFEVGPQGNGGTKIGYKDEKFEVAAKVASYEVMSKNVDNWYTFGLYGKVVPSDMITVEAEGNFAGYDVDESASTSDIKMSFGAKAVAKPVADLTVTLASDMGIVAEELEYDFFGQVGYKAILSAGVYGGTTLKESTEDLDMAVFGKVSSSDLVENLAANLTVMAYNLLSEPAGDNTTPLGIAADVSYKVVQNDVNYVKPYAKFYGQTNYADADAEIAFGSALELGVDYQLFTNTCITAKYAAGSASDQVAGAVTKVGNLIKDGAGMPDKKGAVTIGAKITY
jgi:hypothetical protein